VYKLCVTLFFSLFLILLSKSPAQAKGIETTTLANGLKVILLEEHKAPVVTFQIWYRVGSRNEVNGKTGLSHLTEHMMFKGTHRNSKGEFSRIVAKNGGTENAFTGKDYTAYFENFSSERLDLSLQLEADRMVNLLMDPKEFELEREVVKEERRLRTEDDPISFLIENLYATAFMAHPYRTPVIGWMSDLNNLTRDDLYHHYKRYYIPNNAIIVVVGDFDAKDLLPKIRRYFEKIPRQPEPPQITTEEPEQLGERRITIKREAQLPFVMTGYKVPNYKNPSDSFALSLLANILTAGKSSRLYQSLVYEKQLALEIGGEYSGVTTNPELFYLYGVLHQKKRPEAFEAALYAELERIKQEVITPQELQKAKNQVEAAFIMGRDSNFFQAMQFGTFETVRAGIPYFEHYVENIRKVTAEDIVRVAQTYLVQDKRTVGILLPKTTLQNETTQ
jgi:zinc protease